MFGKFTSLRSFVVIACRALGYVPTFLAALLIAAYAWITLLVIVPYIYSSLILQASIFILSSVNLGATYYLLYKTLMSPLATGAQIIEGGNMFSSMPRQYCSKCEQSIPYHAHHCSICEICVMEHDHHCIFINKCIGLGNYEHFINFLYSLMTGTLLYLLISTPFIFERGRMSRIFSPLVLAALNFSIMLAAALLLGFAFLSGIYKFFLKAK